MNPLASNSGRKDARKIRSSPPNSNSAVVFQGNGAQHRPKSTDRSMARDSSPHHSFTAHRSVAETKTSSSPTSDRLALSVSSFQQDALQCLGKEDSKITDDWRTSSTQPTPVRSSQQALSSFTRKRPTPGGLSALATHEGYASASVTKRAKNSHEDLRTPRRVLAAARYAVRYERQNAEETLSEDSVEGDVLEGINSLSKRRAVRKKIKMTQGQRASENRNGRPSRLRKEHSRLEITEAEPRLVFRRQLPSRSARSSNTKHKWTEVVVPAQMLFDEIQRCHWESDALEPEEQEQYQQQQGRYLDLWQKRVAKILTRQNALVLDNIEAVNRERLVHLQVGKLRDDLIDLKKELRHAEQTVRHLEEQQRDQLKLHRNMRAASQFLKSLDKLRK